MPRQDRHRDQKRDQGQKQGQKPGQKPGQKQGQKQGQRADQNEDEQDSATGAVISSGALQCSGRLMGDVSVTGGVLSLSSVDALKIFGALEVLEAGAMEVVATPQSRNGGIAPLTVQGEVSFAGTLHLRLGGEVMRDLQSGDHIDLLRTVGPLSCEDSARVVVHSDEHWISARGYAFELRCTTGTLHALATRAESKTPSVLELLMRFFRWVARRPQDRYAR